MNYESLFLQKIKTSDILIIRGDTGSGKSTQTATICINNKIKLLSSQPRVINTILISKYVAQINNINIGEEVGYINGEDKKPGSVVNFVTHGTLKNLLINNKITDDTIIAFDEFHEYPKDMELSIALIKQKELKNKILIISATMERSVVEEYFNNKIIDEIHFGGSKFDVTSKVLDPTDDNISNKIFSHLKNKERILFFMDGEESIEKYAKIIEVRNNIEKLNFDLVKASSKTENLYEAIKDKNKACIILSTDICAAGITPENLDVVMDLGVRKTMNVRNGIYMLTTEECSQSEIEQRKGRCGRTKPGKHYLFTYNSNENRLLFPVSEIQRSSIDNIVLNIASMNLRTNDLEFIHQPNFNKIIESEEYLKKMGCLDNNYFITDKGIEINKYPLDVKYACILHEGIKNKIGRQTALMCALMSNESPFNKMSIDISEFSDIEDSDILIKLDVFFKLKDISYEQKKLFNVDTFKYQKILNTYNNIIKTIPYENEDIKELDFVKLKECLIKGYEKTFRFNNIYKGNVILTQNGFGVNCNLSNYTKIKYDISKSNTFVGDIRRIERGRFNILENVTRY